MVEISADSFSFLTGMNHLLLITPQQTWVLAGILVVLLLLVFTISGAEVAFFSLNRKDINMLKTKQHAAARRIISLLEEPKEFYVSLLMSGIFFSICTIVLANHFIETYLPVSASIFRGLPWFSYAIHLLIRVLIIGFVLLFFGKMLPKIWATQNNLRFAYGSSAIVEAIHLLFRRISSWLVKIADRIGKTAGADKSNAMSIRELDEAIDIKSDEEASPDEKNIMKGVVKFGNITVKQIMRSRLDVSGVEYNLAFPALLSKVEELHYSRLPVYRNSLDDVVGLINTKDLLPYLGKDENFDWHPLIRPAYFVPEPKLIEDLLRDFQQKRIHFAVVVDEFGGSSGIVTMEDILEEVIGDIKDEFDEEETQNRQLDANTYIFEGKTMIHDLCRIMKLPIDTFDAVRGESESLAGLVLELAGEIPDLNQVISSGDFEFTVVQADSNRLLQVKVAIKPKAENK